MVLSYQQEFKLLERFVQEHWGIPTNLAQLTLVRKFNLGPVRFNKIVKLLQASNSIYVIKGHLYPPERVDNEKICRKCMKQGYGYRHKEFRVKGKWYEKELFRHYTKGKRTQCYIRGSCHRIDVEAEKAKGDLRHWTDTNTYTNTYKEQGDLPNVMEEEGNTISAKYKTRQPTDSSKMGEEEPEGRGVGNDPLLQRNSERGTGKVRTDVSGREGLRKGSTANSPTGAKETLNPKLIELLKEAKISKGPLAEMEEELRAGRGNVAVVEETE